MTKRSREASLSHSSDDLASFDEYSSVSLTNNILPNKYTSLDSSTFRHVPEVMRCSLPPHQNIISFSSYEDYEVHYAKTHTNRCRECGRNFPTDHFLGLHIEENHNPLREALQERGEKTYGCFVEDCERKCSTPQKRRLHLIDKHMFPRVSAYSQCKPPHAEIPFKTYNFYVVNDGIDKHSSMLRPGGAHRRRISLPSDSKSTGRSRRISQVTDFVPSATSEGSKAPRLLKRDELPDSDEERTRSDHEDSVPRGPDLPLTINLKDPGNAPKPTRDGEQFADAPAKDSIADLEDSMSALKFVPTSVTLRRGKKKIG